MVLFPLMIIIIILFRLLSVLMICLKIYAGVEMPCSYMTYKLYGFGDFRYRNLGGYCCAGSLNCNVDLAHDDNAFIAVPWSCASGCIYESIDEPQP
jgi:hypothetical protein